MPSPANKSAPISTGLHPPNANAKKDKTPRNSPGNNHAGGRTPRTNTNAALPLVAPPDPKALTKKARKAVNVKGNRGKGQSKSGAGGVAVDGDDKDEHESGTGSSSEEYNESPETGSAPKAEVKMDELVRAAEERAANEPVKLSAGYEIITNPASRPMLFDPRRGRIARKDSIASSTGFTDQSDWCELDMDGVEVPVQRAKYAEVLKRAATAAPAANAVIGGARA